MKLNPESVQELKWRCESLGWTIGFAESCTGGLLSAWLTEIPGVSKIFVGSIVSYAREAKVDLLGVPESLIAALGEVSEPVARSMVQGARAALNCHWAVAITGIAGPTGGTKEKPVGTVCFAVAGPGVELSVLKQFGSGLERHEIQQKSAEFAFDLLLSAMR